jgi:hypothetical protein
MVSIHRQLKLWQKYYLDKDDYGSWLESQQQGKTEGCKQICHRAKNI